MPEIPPKKGDASRPCRRIWLFCTTVPVLKAARWGEKEGTRKERRAELRQTSQPRHALVYSPPSCARGSVSSEAQHSAAQPRSNCSRSKHRSASGIPSRRRDERIAEKQAYEEAGCFFRRPNRFSNSLGAVGGRTMGLGAMKLTIFSWTLYLHSDEQLLRQGAGAGARWRRTSAGERSSASTLFSGSSMRAGRQSYASLSGACWKHTVMVLKWKRTAFITRNSRRVWMIPEPRIGEWRKEPIQWTGHDRNERQQHTCRQIKSFKELLEELLVELGVVDEFRISIHISTLKAHRRWSKNKELNAFKRATPELLWGLKSTFINSERIRSNLFAYCSGPFSTLGYSNRHVSVFLLSLLKYRRWGEGSSETVVETRKSHLTKNANGASLQHHPINHSTWISHVCGHLVTDILRQ